MELEGVNGISVESDKEEIISIRKGAWSPQEDSTLINYIAVFGEGRWNHLARNSGLKRTGKSCRMRWKNYLHPNVRRGNFTQVEQLCILELRCLYGNRWSKIAEFLPGRTDNEIKNYWRTRVQKEAKQLNYDINSPQFTDFIRNIWLPTLAQQIHGIGPIQIEAAEAHQVMDSLSNYIWAGPDCLQSPFIQGIDDPIPACFNSGDFSDMLPIDDWFLACP